MKIRLAAGAVVAAATLAIPAVAHAVTYAPFEATDPTGDVSTGPVVIQRGTLYPQIDMTTVRGARSAVQHSIAIKYVGLVKSPYSRYAVALAQPNSQKVRILEVRVGGGGAVNTAFYTVTPGSGDESSSIQQTYCTGARIVPDFAKDKITAVFPQKCFTNTFPQGVFVYAMSGQWTSTSWTSGPLSNDNSGSGADGSDTFNGIWDYQDGAVTPSNGRQKGFPNAPKLPKLY